MVYCTKCGHQLADGAKFCYECGAAVTASGHTSTTTAENADIEIGVSVLLNNDNKQDFTQNEVYLEHAHKTVAVRIPNWITVGQMVRLRGEGNTTLSGKKGDLLLRIDHIKYKENSNQPPTRKVGYEGEVHKCPNCGDILDAYESVCETCGWERRGTKASVAVKEFEGRFLAARTTTQQVDLIRTFAVPNNREDIREFLALAISNIDSYTFNSTDKDAEDAQLANAWTAKFEQVFEKAMMLFGDTPELQIIYKKYRRKKWKISAARLKNSFFRFCRHNKAWVISVSSVLGGIALLALLISIPEIKHKNKESRLETLVVQVEQYIEIGDYENARIVANQIIYTDGVLWYYNNEEKWADVRYSLLSKIAQEQGLPIVIGISSEALEGMKIDDVEAHLRGLGFANIETKAVSNWFVKNYVVTEVSINGNSDFGMNDTFTYDAIIVITYVYE